MNADGVPATYHDGLTTRARAARLRFGQDGTLTVEFPETGESSLLFNRSQVRVESRLGNGARFVRLPDDQRCEVADNDALDAALTAWARPGFAAWLHRMEQSWRLVLAGAAVLLVLCWATIVYGVPWASKRVAFMLPDKVLNALGDQTLATFDKTVFKPSELDEARRRELREKFTAFLRAAGDRTDYRIEFRASPRFGANAFALPSGVIVITDELIKLAEDDAEILGVVAHECGHVRHRHVLRSVLQNSAVFVVITMVTGDVSSTTAIGGAVPAYLLQSKFSREFEVEADAYAVELMKRAGVPTGHLAAMLERLEASHRPEPAAKPADDGRSAMDYISTHPPTRERVRAIRDADKAE